MQTIKISVIIPSYNSADCLPELLNNILNRQTTRNIEVILIDDGSTDKTKEILSDIKDDRLIYYFQDNKGAGAARNTGISLARGEYLICLDADDLYDTSMLEQMYDCAKEFNADIVHCSFDLENYKNKVIVRNTGFKNIPELKVFSFKENPNSIIDIRVNPNSKMYRTNFVKDNCIEYSEIPCSNDVTFYIKTMNLAQRVICLPKSLFISRRFYLDSSITSSRIYKIDYLIQDFIDNEKWFRKHFVNKEEILALTSKQWGSILYNSSFGYNKNFLDKLDLLMDMFPYNTLNDNEIRMFLINKQEYLNQSINRYKVKYYSGDKETSDDLRNYTSELYRIFNFAIIEDFIRKKYDLSLSVTTTSNRSIKKKLLPASKQNLDDQIERLEKDIQQLKKDNEQIIEMLYSFSNRFQQ